jgi:hypothetical protein
MLASRKPAERSLSKAKKPMNHHQSINKIRMLLYHVRQFWSKKRNHVLKDEKLTKPTASSDGAVVAVLVRANQE